MRKPRLKAPESYPVAYYHCISRVVDGQFHLGEVEKEQFVSFMREYETFCGVRVVTFCIMSNHFHVLVEVPRPPEETPDDEALLAKVESLSGLGGGGTTRQLLERFREQGHHGPAQALREQILSRMWDVSAFMKLLKQRFTQWFNHRHSRRGTLWEQRFKSVLVEGAGDVLATMAAYIDLNPVRAGLVDDPKDYRWSGYGEAVAGKRSAREALRLVIAGAQRVSVEKVRISEALKQYRMWLYGQGEISGTSEAGQPAGLGFDREAVAQVIAQKGKVPLRDYLRLRVRYFSDGVALGTREFVNTVFGSFREQFGPTRKDGARPLQGLATHQLYSLRALRLRAVQ